MAYCLLTGASGLLGSYLLRDCLRAGYHMAVLVRPTETESGGQRIDTLMTQWEERTGQVLPRPVTFEGDLCRPDLGLSASDHHWIGRHCRAAIHSAASLTFYGTDRQREPWLSNVEGTRSVLELCARCGIRRFHHVSTAYVCGLREGQILESELDVGQEMGNDYERSKVEAEKLVRAAPLGAVPTIYRPSIIVGDAQTGYTSTFHGFYAMVRLAHTLASQMVLGSITAGPMIAAFGLDGHERKNFVPVDWVSSVIAQVLGRPECQGRTYHLTAPAPTPVAVWSRAIQGAVERYSSLADPSDPACRDARWFQEMFRGQAQIYRAYRRDDPTFDRTNTNAAAPDLPCPTMDYETLMRMARFAIETNFGRRQPRPRLPDSEIRAHMRRLFAPDNREPPSESAPVLLGLQVNGQGGGQWKLLTRAGRCFAAEDGISEQCGAVFHLTSDTFRRLAGREMPVAQAVRQGRVTIAGNGLRPSVLETILQTVVTPGSA